MNELQIYNYSKKLFNSSLFLIFYFQIDNGSTYLNSSLKTPLGIFPSTRFYLCYNLINKTLSCIIIDLIY